MTPLLKQETVCIRMAGVRVQTVDIKYFQIPSFYDRIN